MSSAAAVAGLALTHTIGKAAVKGPGHPQRAVFPYEETLVMAGLMLSAWAVAHFAPSEGPDRYAWGPDRLA